MLFNLLKLAQKHSKKELMDYIKTAKQEISKDGSKLVRKNSKIFTHCHSSSVMGILKYAKNKGNMD